MEKNEKKSLSKAPRHEKAGTVAVDRRRLMATVAAVFAVIAILGAGIGTGVALAYKHVTVTLDGTSQQYSTFGGTVSDLFKDEGIALQPADQVTPALSTQVTEGMKIKVESSRQLVVHVGGKETTANTTADSVTAAVAELWPGQPLQFVESIGKDYNGKTLSLFTEGQVVELVHDGSTETVKAHVGEDALVLVQRYQVVPGQLDEVNVFFDAKGKAVVQVVRIKVEEVTVAEEIPFQTETIKDSSKYTDEKTVTQQGVKGSKNVVKKITSRDGVVVSAEVLEEKITAQPVVQKETVGTKKRPVERVTGSDVWAKLARCESGGNPRTNTGNGYYGLYQFSAATWRSVGGAGLPHEASAAEQTKRAQILQKRSGWGQWPACTRKLGLR